MATTRLAGALVALLTCMAVAGCHKPEEPTPTPREDKQQYTFRWIRNASLDLMSPEGTFARAISESYWSQYSAEHRGRAALAEKGYPGVEHAENNVWDAYDIGGDPAQRTTVGTDYYEVVAFSQDGDRYTATICRYTGQTAVKWGDGTYASRGSTPTGTASVYVFGPDPALDPAKQHEPPAQQRGPARRPTDNVFGTWLLFEEPRISEEQHRACNKLAPGTPTNWPDPYKRSDPPPTLSPDPGWPEASSA